MSDNNLLCDECAEPACDPVPTCLDCHEASIQTVRELAARESDKRIIELTAEVDELRAKLAAVERAFNWMDEYASVRGEFDDLHGSTAAHDCAEHLRMRLKGVRFGND